MNPEKKVYYSKAFKLKTKDISKTRQRHKNMSGHCILSISRIKKLDHCRRREDNVNSVVKNISV